MWNGLKILKTSRQINFKGDSYRHKGRLNNAYSYHACPDFCLFVCTVTYSPIVNNLIKLILRCYYN